MKNVIDKIYLGLDTSGKRIWLTKHSWDCVWYWSFGYLGNANLHYHFEEYLTNASYGITTIFRDTWLTQDNWWVLLDLFKQAYALKAAAEVYSYGGHITYQTSLTNVIQSSDKAAAINADLEIVLDTLWDYLLANKP